MAGKLEVGIYFGAMVPSIASQLAKQKLPFNKVEVALFQKCVDAMTLLRVHGLLSDSVSEKMRRAMHKKIVQHVVSEIKNPGLKKQSCQKRILFGTGL